MPTFRGAPPTSAVAELTAAGVHTVNISSRFRHEHDRVSGWAKELSIPGRYGAFDDASTVAETKRVLRAGIPQPFFVATHLMGAHEPYEPLAACAARSEGYDRYLCALRLLDERVGDILRALSDAGLGDDTVVVISADHGEEFGEHGARYHANTVYDEVLRVPLLVRIPGQRPRRFANPSAASISCRRCSEPPIFRAIRCSSATTFPAVRVPATARNSRARGRSMRAACSSRRRFPSWSGTRSSSSIGNRVSRSISTSLRPRGAPAARSRGAERGTRPQREHGCLALRARASVRTGRANRERKTLTRVAHSKVGVPPGTTSADGEA